MQSKPIFDVTLCTTCNYDVLARKLFSLEPLQKFCQKKIPRKNHLLVRSLQPYSSLATGYWTSTAFFAHHQLSLESEPGKQDELATWTGETSVPN